MSIILASRNAHKLRELRRMLPGIDLEPLPEGVALPPETGDSFAANAILKARAAHDATGSAVIADDSGIEVSALGGAPGIRSARFAGEDATDEENLSLLLERTADAGDRRAAYVCAISYIAPDGTEELFEARCDGELVAEPRGSGGFGYDPAFVPRDTDPDDRRTMAELEPAEKDAISHRGRAARMVLDRLAGEAATRP
jgi:XTP/dITP diphosphohydrolase